MKYTTTTTTNTPTTGSCSGSSSVTDSTSSKPKAKSKKIILGPTPSFLKFQNYLFNSAPLNAPALKGYAAQLKKLIQGLRVDIPIAQNQYDKVKPYLSKMLWAVVKGMGSKAWFNKMASHCEGQMPLPYVINPVRPTYCVHLACAECICSWLQAAPMLDIDAAQRARSRQMALSRNAVDVEREKHAPCMLCRQPFSASQLVCVDVNLAKDKKKKKEKNESDGKKKTIGGGIVRVNNAPMFTPALQKEDVDAIGTKI